LKTNIVSFSYPRVIGRAGRLRILCANCAAH